MMNKEIFWEIIGACRQYVSDKKEKVAWEDTDIRDSYIDYLRGTLSTYSTDDVIIFDRIFRYYHSKLFRDNIWNWLINEGYHASDDAFHYFTSWIISLGHDVYMDCISQPNILENFIDDDEDIYFERLEYVANKEIEDRVENLTGKLNTRVSNVINGINLELEEYWTDDTEYGPIKRSIEAWKKEKSENNSENEENNVNNENEENVKTINVHGKSSLYSQNDRQQGREYLLSLYKNKDGEIEVECNEDCENCPMEMFGEKCE